MVLEAVECPTCGGIDIHRHGQSATGKKRYICCNEDCTRKTFILDYTLYLGGKLKDKIFTQIRKSKSRDKLEQPLGTLSPFCR
ncbi:hypothetical protein HC246_16640 [Pseudanabaena yagii GIHE-NHR1]|uniref:InsA N-terminal zinc ribbon domain-containing protein n=1 Tax=Pseudanabaena yagii GIHE-NHR1 TaxID=2722753 RepID=A0ABX1LTX0_9CYAN|nr:hypothetical protein [Pseudanabaena yagii GIHE-NHR1]